MEIANQVRKVSKTAKNRYRSVVGSVLTMFFFILASMAGIVVMVYGLYRIAIFNKRVYGFMFLTAAAFMCSYFGYQLFRRQVVSKLFFKALKVVVLTCFSLLIVTAFALCGALILRSPIVGTISVVILLFIVFYLLPKLHVFTRIKRYFS